MTREVDRLTTTASPGVDSVLNVERMMVLFSKQDVTTCTSTRASEWQSFCHSLLKLLALYPILSFEQPMLIVKNECKREEQ